MGSILNEMNGASIIALPNKYHNYRTASIPSDGIRLEVVNSAVEFVQKVAKTLRTFTIGFDHIPWVTA